MLRRRSTSVPNFSNSIPSLISVHVFHEEISCDYFDLFINLTLAGETKRQAVGEIVKYCTYDVLEVDLTIADIPVIKARAHSSCLNSDSSVSEYGLQFCTQLKPLWIQNLLSVVSTAAMMSKPVKMFLAKEQPGIGCIHGVSIGNGGN